MKIKVIKAWIVIAALFVTLVAMFVVFSANERQRQINGLTWQWVQIENFT
jgi:hypothetical protein